MRWRWPHFHDDPHWRVRYVHAYYQCRCGARRVRRAYVNQDGPVEAGWPDLVDSHGYPVDDSGWVVAEGNKISRSAR